MHQSCLSKLSSKIKEDIKLYYIIILNSRSRIETNYLFCKRERLSKSDLILV